MQMTFSTISVLLFLVGCGQTQKNVKIDDLFFKAQIFPAFDEHAEITILKIDRIYKTQFLLKEAYANDKPADTFYSKTIVLSESQFQKVDTEILQKVITGHSNQKTGIRDGIWFGFTFIHKGDTSSLSFNNPQKGIDSAAVEIINKEIDNFKSIYNDTIINDYLYDIQTYIYNSKKDSHLKGKRAIDSLRRTRYSR